MNYATGAEFIGSPVATAVVGEASCWRRRSDLVKHIDGADAGVVESLVDRLIDATILHVLGDASRREERRRATFHGWNPVVGFFHRATRDSVFQEAGDTSILGLNPKLPPGPKQHPDVPKHPLPEYPRDHPLPQTLLARRTWRSFGKQPITRSQLATLLDLTWGVQRWVRASPDVRLALKTSPSGGALHSIEAYPIVLAAEDVEHATYHYDSGGHALSRLSTCPPRELLSGFLPAQPGFHEPALLVFMTSVFARVHWKYPDPRAYRVILLEAGHLAQTFCLVATWLGLAPFCTAALNDEAIERHLGIDGVAESVLYAVGVGSRPAESDWSPLPDMQSPPPVDVPTRAMTD